MGNSGTKEENTNSNGDNVDLLDNPLNDNPELNEKYENLLKNYPPLGYRVLGIQADSPASYTGLVAFFDFIIAANNIPLRTLDTTFIGLIQASEEKPLTLTVYNTKNHSVREVVIVPSRKWPGEGMLGVTIRFDTYKDAEEHIIHVLEVEENSPADLAGLIAESDYILGTAEKAFKNPEGLFEILKNNLEHPLEVFIYNCERDEIRTSIIMPTEQWGGEGILGASVGYGYLHRLSRSATRTLGRFVENHNNRAIHTPLAQPPQLSPQPQGSAPMAHVSPILGQLNPNAIDIEGNSAGITEAQEPQHLLQGLQQSPLQST